MRHSNSIQTQGVFSGADGFKLPVNIVLNVIYLKKLINILQIFVSIELILL